MASSSSSSSSKCRRSYDVFLSFRGTDVRNNFVGHLYTDLIREGINTYIDSEELEKGQQITPALMEAIEESQIAIVVFSKNYASSSFCLDELTKIMERWEQKELIVWPVFYKVEPREVRTPRAIYKEAMDTHKVKCGEDPEKVKRWERWDEALSRAGNLSGWDFPGGDGPDGYEPGLTQDIVQKISTQLDRMPYDVANYLVGIDSRLQELEKVLNRQTKDDVLMVGLWGQGGVGKTTLARAIYNAVFREFEGSSFLERVREKSKNPNGLVLLQKNLLSEVLPRKEFRFNDVGIGRKLIQDRLGMKKVLIILDDVDDECQLDALARNCNWFGKGSRIIITTRNNHLMTSYTEDSRHLYEVEVLKGWEAFELFRKHAFPGSQKIEIRRDLVDSVLHYASGLPLALEVLGSMLRGSGEEEWESILRRLAQSPPKQINDVLKVSYDGLECNEKEIFLDIACFFKGQSTRNIKKILDSCGFESISGVKFLIKRSLIREEHQTFQMHDLIQSMGKDIILEECRDDPGKRSRLWLQEDVFNVLLRDEGTKAAKAIVLELPKPKKTYISPKAFKKMMNLRLLILVNMDNSSRGPIHLPNALKWFQWPNCPSVPEFSYGPKELVGLDMRNSKIQVGLEQFKDFKNLKFINFSFCQSLVCMPDLNLLPNLKQLDLYWCKNLQVAHESVGNHSNLRFLNLGECSNLPHLCDVLQSPHLGSLDLSNCSKLQRFPDIPDKNTSLRKLFCGGTSIKELPASIENLVSLKDMLLDDNKELAILPSSIYRLKNLRSLTLDGCSQLKKFPKEEEDLSDPQGFPWLMSLSLRGCNLSEVEFLENNSYFPSLMDLDLQGNNFTNLPSCGNLYSLLELDVSYCKRLQEIPQIPPTLSQLSAISCESLRKIPSNMCEASTIDLSGCYELISNGTTLNHLFEFEQLHTKTDYRVILPEGKLTEWLLPNKEGYMSFMASKDLYKKFVGLAFCLTSRKIKAEFNMYDYFELKAFVNGERTGLIEERVHSWDMDKVYLQFHRREQLWGVDPLVLKDWSHFQICITASRRVIANNCRFKLICKPLENDLKLQHNQLLDSALLYELRHEDGPTSTEEDSPSKLVHEGLNMAHISIEKHRYSVISHEYRNVRPGGEMPEEFVLVEDDTICFMASQDLYDKFLGLALCVVFSVEDGKKEISFDIVPHVNGQRRNVLSGTLGPFDSDHTWIQYLKTNVLWGLLEGAVDFGEFDEKYLRFSLRLEVSGGTVKKLGYVIRCTKLEDDLKLVLEDNQFVNLASLREDSCEPEDSRIDPFPPFCLPPDRQRLREYSRKCHLHREDLEASDSETDQTKDEAKKQVVLVGNSHRKSPHAAIEYLVGIDKQVEDMMDLLDLEVSDVRIVGIWGKGGVGKTTLAKVIYEQISSRFDSCSFLADVAATTKQLGGVRFLQSKLMSDILKQEYEVDHVVKGVNFFKEVLRNMKVLIVLDDVEVRSHLHEIVGEKLDWFGYGSRIIVTTSITSILPKFISRGLAHAYQINVMNNDQALELFQKHALPIDLPIPGFDEAAKDVINLANGIPLLIEVIGSLLDRNLVEKLIAREEPILHFDLRIQEILMVSYEELSDVQREIFLDIACLPADVDCRIASFMWHNPHFPPSDGVDALHVKSLVKIGRNNELGMHGLLREFGQQIIRTEDHLDPGRRGRLCNLELPGNTKKMEGTEDLNFVTEDFRRMPNIRFLILDRANVAGDFANVFLNLKWLRWQGCTRDFKATNFHVEKLVILDLSWSKVTEDWGGWKIKMPQLKVLNLTGCADLLISPDLSSFPELEILILEQCSQLMKLDPSIRHLKYLTSLNLRFCNELNMLPIELGDLKALKELLIDGTSVQEIPVSMGYMEQLEIFSASNCLQLSHLPDSLCGLTALSVLLLENAKITRIPDSVGKLVKLRHLSLKDCRWIERLPDSIRNLEMLERLDITGTGISKLPDSITCLRRLKVLKMDSCFIRELPRAIGNLTNLEELHASHCGSLKGAIPTAIKSLDHLRILKLGHSSISVLPPEIISLSCLQTLDLLRCNKIQALPELPSSLTCLRVSSERMKALPNLKGLVKLEEICLGDTDPKELICASPWKKPRSNLRDPLVVPVGLPKLKILELSHSKIINLPLMHGSLSCTHLKKLVLSGVNLQEVSELPSSLSVLSIQRCLSLKGLPAVGHLRTLSELNLIQSAIEEIKGLEGLIALEFLNMSYCEIQNLNGLGQLRALRSLILSDCDSLDKLPDISNLKMLNVLEVQRCRKIRDIEGLMELTSLEVLHVGECKAENTQQVQDALKLVMARSINS